MTAPRVSDKLPRSQAFLLLRYTLIIAVAYLLLVEHDFSSAPAGLILLIAVALASNVAMAQLPKRITDSTAFNAGVILGDTLWITAALLYSGLFGPEFFYLYFFVLLLAAIGESLGLIAIGTIAVCVAYIFVLSATGGSASLWSSDLLIRIPFLLTAAGFYGYLVDRVRRERQRAREEADTVARLEDAQRKLAEHTQQLERANEDLAREIAERERVEQALKAAKDYAENLIASSLDIIVSTDVDRKIVEFNGAAEDAFGYRKADVVGAPVDLLYAEPSETSRIQKSLRNHGRFAGEIRSKRKNGEIFYCYLSASVIRDGSGAAVGAVGVSRDITERKRAEEALQESEERFRTIFTEGPLGMAIVGLDYRFVKVNSAMCRLVGYTEQELTGLSFVDITYPEDIEKDVHLSGQVFGGQIPSFQLEKRYLKKNGEIIWINLTASVIRDEDGKPLYGLAMIQDITERKRAEEVLQETNEELRETRHYLARLIEGSTDAIISTNTEGKIVLFNKGAETMLGYPREEIVGQHVTVVYESEERAKEVMRQMRRHGGTAAGFETVLRAKDGSLIPSLISASILYDAEGREAGTVGFNKDLRERKRAEEELRTTQLQLMQSAKLESVGRLAAGVAHEVKNPLAIIQQGLAYLSSHALATTDGDTVALVLDKMDSAVRRADRVIRGLVDFSAPSPVDVRPMNVNFVVEQSLLLVKHELVRAHVTVVKEPGESLPPVKLDLHRMEQVFVNLFMNAIQAMPRGGTLTVRTTVKRLTGLGPDFERERADLVLIQVEDTGTGIPADKLDRVFDPFFTTKPTGQGTGLGLTVTRKIVELHGGTIDIRNRQEGGSRVTLVFKTEGGDTDAEETHPPYRQ